MDQLPARRLLIAKSNHGIDAHCAPRRDTAGEYGNRENHPPVRNRKLLLHRREIDKLLSITREKGLALIPIKIYLKNGRIKCEIAVAKGKKLHDKRESSREREANRDVQRAMRSRRG